MQNIKGIEEFSIFFLEEIRTIHFSLYYNMWKGYYGFWKLTLIKTVQSAFRPKHLPVMSINLTEKTILNFFFFFFFTEQIPKEMWLFGKYAGCKINDVNRQPIDLIQNGVNELVICHIQLHHFCLKKLKNWFHKYKKRVEKW